MGESKFLLPDRPTVTAMCLADTVERFEILASKAIRDGADAIGFQFELLIPEQKTRSSIEKIIAACQGKPLYFTNYGWHQPDVPDEELAKDLILAAECGAALIDMPGDMFDRNARQMTENPDALEKQSELIRKVHLAGAEVLISSHVLRFLKTDEVLAQIQEQNEHGADICKIVTVAETEDELLANFETSLRLKEQTKPVLFVCSGGQSRRHRLFGPLLTRSLYLCCPEHDRFATAAQPLVKTARDLVDLAFGNGEY